MNSGEVGKCGHHTVYTRDQVTRCQICTLYHVCRCVKENPWASLEPSAAVSILKNELLQVFLDQVWNNKALNEHITIPLPKVSSPQSILGSCTGHSERCSRLLIKNNWLSVLPSGAGFHWTWMEACVTGWGMGRCSYKSLLGSQRRLSKATLAPWNSSTLMSRLDLQNETFSY